MSKKQLIQLIAVLAVAMLLLSACGGSGSHPGRHRALPLSRLHRGRHRRSYRGRHGRSHCRSHRSTTEATAEATTRSHRH